MTDEPGVGVYGAMRAETQRQRSRRAARNANGELRGAPLARLVRCALIRAPRTNRSIGRLGYRHEPARAATRSAAQLAVRCKITEGE